jgi:hypothetical protein
MRLSRFLAAVGVTCGLLALASPAAAGTTALPRLLAEDFGTFAVRPAQVVISGDGSAIIGGPAAWVGRNPDPQHPGSQLGHITWATWTTTGATGSGDFWLDNCKPDCAGGTYYPHLVKLVASHVGGGVFGQLVLTFVGRQRTARYAVKHLNPGPAGYVWG